MKSYMNHLTLAVVVMLVGGCGGGEDSASYDKPADEIVCPSCNIVDSLIFDKETYVLGVGETVSLKVWATCDGGDKRYNVVPCGMKFIIKDKNIANMMGNTGLYARNEGNTQIEAVYFNDEVNATIRVVAPYVNTLEVLPQNVLMDMEKPRIFSTKGTKTDGATAKPMNGTKWYAEDETCLDVDVDLGIVEGLKPCKTNLFAIYKNSDFPYREASGSAVVTVVLKMNDSQQ